MTSDERAARKFETDREADCTRDQEEREHEFWCTHCQTMYHSDAQSDEDGNIICSYCYKEQTE